MPFVKGYKMTREQKRKIGDAHRGMKRSAEARRNMSIAAMGKPGTNLGKKFSSEHRAKISSGNKGKVISEQQKAQISGENSKLWRGDDVKYRGLHAWVDRQLGKPQECVSCGTTRAKKFEWANRSHEYLRDLSDWVRLCTSCHHKYDSNQLIIEGP